MGNIEWQHVTRDNRETLYKGRQIVAIRSSKGGVRGNWSVFELGNEPGGIGASDIPTSALNDTIRAHYAPAD